MKRISGRTSMSSGGSRRRFDRDSSEHSVSLLMCIVMSVVGFAMTAPFFWRMIFIPPQHPTIWTYITLFSMMLGGPMMFYGLFSFFCRKATGPVDTTAIDIARIRFAAEAHLLRDMIKDTKGDKHD